MRAINPDYYATSAGRITLREGIRQTVRVRASMKKPDGSAAALEETLPEGLSVPGPDSSDVEIDEKMRQCGQTSYHAGGGC